MQTEHNEGGASDVLKDVAEVARSEVEDAKVRLSKAADRVRQEAQNAGSTVSTLVMDELDRRAGNLGQQFHLIASRLRGETASDPDAPAPLMAERAADLVDDLSQKLEGQSIRELGSKIDRFGHQNPALFFLGCLVTGAIAGRMIVASSDENGKGAFAASGKSSESDQFVDRQNRPRWGETGAERSGDHALSGPHVTGAAHLPSDRRPGSGTDG